jgi:membrane protease YdiL (CAAX protease family)
MPFLVFLVVATVTVKLSRPREQRPKMLAQVTFLAYAFLFASIFVMLIQTVLVLRLAPVAAVEAWAQVLGDRYFVIATMALMPLLHFLMVMAWLPYAVPTSAKARITTFVCVSLILAGLIGFGVTAEISENMSTYSLSELKAAGRLSPQLGEQFVNSIRENPLRMIRALIPLMLLFVILLIVGPIAEEFFWRGCALPFLERGLGARGAILITAAFFGSLHVEWNSLSLLELSRGLLLGILGLALGWLYTRKRSLVLCVLVHSFYNLAVLIVVFVMALR